MTRLVRICTAVLACLFWAQAALSDPGVAAKDKLFHDLMIALRLADTAQIMREEGLSYGTELARDMIDPGDMPDWQQRVGKIYDPVQLERLIHTRLRTEIAPDMLEPMVAFFSSDLGGEVVGLELAARSALLDTAVEEAAKEEYLNLAEQDDPIIGQIEQMIDDSDLVTFNVSGILNSNMMLYRGMADGGALDLSEQEILDDIWSQHHDVRTDSLDWIETYFLTAYHPLPPEDLERYAAFWRTESGVELNRALFAAFDGIYEELSYLLGRSVADHIRGQKL